MSLNKVLIVDDDANIRTIAQISLEDSLNVVLAGSGSEALEVAAREKPDFILLDRMMPGMDGLETLSRLKQDDNTKSIPIIFLTAKIQGHEMADYNGLDVAGVLAKPFDPMTLLDDIRKILENR
ncbi:MAG: response regulator [Candidatus Obscuribacterales bacterium]|nr:response regulator [Candidatus Obscuribacterales bacterium]